jgi:hypothetical protein
MTQPTGLGYLTISLPEGGEAMPYTTLEAVHDANLPITLTRQDDIDAVRAYVAAGLVVADIPPKTCVRPGEDVQPPAVISALTPAGRKAVEKLRATRSLSRRRFA